MPAADRIQLLRHDLAQVYRPQREWIEGRGVLIVVAHFFSGIGAGAWLLGVAFEVRLGLWLGLAAVGVCSGLAHLAFLGRPERFWRILARPRTSWISRGIWSIGVFLVSGAAYAMLAAPGPVRALLLVLSLAGAIGVLLYEGFVYAASVAIPFWRTALLPILYVAYGLRGGAALLLVAGALGGAAFDLAAVEALKLWVVASTGVLVALLLVRARSRGGAAERSLERLLFGPLAPSFYGGTVLLGLVLPIGLHAFGAESLAVLAAIGVASLLGDFYVKYCVVKAGVYVPTVGDRGPVR
jgi:formate-dependent nitrite reductase membrane component NrfD